MLIKVCVEVSAQRDLSNLSGRSHFQGMSAGNLVQLQLCEVLLHLWKQEQFLPGGNLNYSKAQFQVLRKAFLEEFLSRILFTKESTVTKEAPAQNENPLLFPFFCGKELCLFIRRNTTEGTKGISWKN